MEMHRCFIAGGMVIALLGTTAAAGLEVTALGKVYRPAEERVVIQQDEADPSGDTSVRNITPENLSWKEKGYYWRNRDLGQVFTADKDFALEAIVLRTGPAKLAVLPGAPGARVFVQFFEVVGQPVINDNGTPQGTEATHGFSTNHRCDDFIEGVTYRPLRIVRGGVFPSIPPTQDVHGSLTDGPQGDAGKLHYMRWRFTGDDRPRFEAGKRYAYMIGFEEPGPARSFTLANRNRAGVDAPPALSDKHDRYHGGWSLRREGDGTLPPTMAPGPNPPSDQALHDRMLCESMFEAGQARYQLSPTTDGYPDVDTYRDHEFYLIAAE